MSVVIIGGNERMVCRYKDICKEYNCEAKVFTKMKGNLKSMIGAPDLLILFTNVVSHKMVCVAKKEAARNSVKLEQIHCGSCNALRSVLSNYA